MASTVDYLSQYTVVQLREALALAEKREEEEEGEAQQPRKKRAKSRGKKQVKSESPSACAKLLRSRNYPNHLWRVMSSERVVINNGEGSTVEIVPGLYRLGDEDEAHNFNASLYKKHGGRKKMVSFRVHTGGQQGTYLRHCGWDLRAHHKESSALYRLDATFYMEEDRFFPGTVSFHSINYDKHYISHRSYCLKIATISKGKQELHRNDASFTIE